jgi:hypothetical protein
MTEETYFILLRAISMAFCKLGSPTGSSLILSDIDLRTSWGFPRTDASRHRIKGLENYDLLPDISPVRSPRPARIPTIPI